MIKSRFISKLFLVGLCMGLVAPGYSQNIDITTLSSSEATRFFATDIGPYVTNSYSTIGDFNGDGTDDFALGSPIYDNVTISPFSAVGAVNVILGPTEGLTEFQLGTFLEDNTLGFRLFGDATHSEIGRTVAPAGDFNGDGFADFLVSSKINKAYIIFGRNGEMQNFSVADLPTSPTYGVTILAAPDHGLGQPAGVGDFNGDGLSDIVLGSAVDRSLDTSATVYLIFGNNSPGSIDLATFQGDGVDGLTIDYPNTWKPIYPSPVSQPCDFNGDGLMDIVIQGEMEISGSYTPLIVITGRSSEIHDYEFSSVMPEDVISINTGAENTFVGALNSRGCAGDFNGDGLSDLYLAAPYLNPLTRTGTGLAFILYGTPITSGTISIDMRNPVVPGTHITGDTSDYIGVTFTPAGDIDNDGLADMILSSKRDFPGRADTKAAFVLYGSEGEGNSIDLNSPIEDTNGFIVGGSEDVNIEPVYSRAGDVDGDGYGDFLVNVDMPGIMNTYRNSFLIYGREKQATVADWALYDL